MTRFGEMVLAKLELDDFEAEEHGPFNKRSKVSSNAQEQWSTRDNGFPITPSHYNPLDEPSPLGLRLKKSPSLMDLIQMRLSQGGASSTQNHISGDNRNSGGVKFSSEKLKASNFPALLLRIGSWEYESRYEGDLVAKCYFAKHKLVWEFLDGVLKCKIEVQWSDIMGLRANCPDNGPGTLSIVLARQPLFYRETNPQPRKHTLWQATRDFTSGQASMFREHFLQCPVGVLNKHFEKLIQSNPRLNMLSQQPFLEPDSPYFDQSNSSFMGSLDDPGSSFEIIPGSDHLGSAIESNAIIEGAEDLKSSNQVFNGTENSFAQEPKALSISVTDFVNHFGHCISEQMMHGNPNLASDANHGQEWQRSLEDIAQHLLNDTQMQMVTACDEKFLMSRVNSLCSLLQDPPADLS